MLTRKTSLESIRRVMTTGFVIQDIAEPLVSFEAGRCAAEARSRLEEMDFDCAGVRREGFVTGILLRDDLNGGQCGDYLQAPPAKAVMPGTASLADVVKGLVEHPRLFVELLGTMGGIVTREDLLKPPVRMWLFGMVTIIEMRLVRLITERFPDDGWQELLSHGRLEKAKRLCHERRRRHREVDVMDCLQLSDKGTIVTRDEKLRTRLRFPSRRRGEEIIKWVEALRNDLAHSQDIITEDWETIVLLSENLDRVIEGPPQTGAAGGPPEAPGTA